MEKDIETGVNVLNRFLHRSKEEQDAIMRDWFKKKATPEFIAKVREEINKKVKSA